MIKESKKMKTVKAIRVNINNIKSIKKFLGHIMLEYVSGYKHPVYEDTQIIYFKKISKKKTQVVDINFVGLDKLKS